MKQWYRSNVTKGILIVVEHVLAVVTAVSLIWVLAYPGMAADIFTKNPAKEYKDSTAFCGEMQAASENIIVGIGTREEFETDGKLDTDKVVDIKTYSENGSISNENSSGLSYRLGDLEQWTNPYEETADQEERLSSTIPSDEIIVCKRADGTYQYYYYSQFEELISNGELSFVMANSDSGMTSEDILSNLRNGRLYQGDFSDFKGLQNQNGKIEYIDCWNYDGARITEDFAPIDGGSILDIANNNPNWNGKLNEAYTILSSTVYQIQEQFEIYRNLEQNWQEGDTNLAYIYVNTETGRVYTNREEFKDYGKLEENIAKISKMGRYVVVKPKLADFKTDLKNTDAASWRDIVQYNGPSDKNFIYTAGVDTKFQIQDSFYAQNQAYTKYGFQIQDIGILGLAAAVLFLAGLVWLTMIAGRNGKDEEVHLVWIDRWKTEIAVVAIGILWAVPFFLVGSGMGAFIVNNSGWTDYSTAYAEAVYAYHSIPAVVTGGVLTAYTCGMFMIGYLSFVRRIKARTLWQNSVLRSLLGFFGQLFANMHFVWKTVILFAGFILIHWIAAASGSGFWFLIMLLVEFVSFIFLVHVAIGRQRLREGIDQISGGEVDYKIPLEHLKGEQLMMAEKVNSIGEGLDAAVEKSMKSERLKTDLITNVSHDIKTPLTSIINYVDLLKQEQFEDPKVQRYLDILEAKAQRLKTLTEDVVEASKVSSGNITLEYMNINLVEMIQQTSGEFEEKFKKRNLKEVLTLPDEEAVIKVDGRRMWRVIENIYNNAAKYAMEGSRIYADLKTTEGSVIFSLKNVSEQPLNITADELTERFIRGDISRSTEGSGLGLSIAKSLTEMQGGKFDLYLDGDLFRVTITFPRMVKMIPEDTQNQ